MPTFANRPYAGPADLEAMVDLLIAARPAERIADYPGIVDLREMFMADNVVMIGGTKQDEGSPCRKPCPP